MGWRETAVVLQKSEQKGSVRLLLLVMSNYADEFGFCWPGVKRLARDTLLSERAVQYLLGKAQVAGELEIYIGEGNFVPEGNGQRGNLYRLRTLPAPLSSYEPYPGYFAFKKSIQGGEKIAPPEHVDKPDKVVQQASPPPVQSLHHLPDEVVQSDAEGGAKSRQKVVQRVAPDPKEEILDQDLSLSQSVRARKARPSPRARAKTTWPNDLILTSEMREFAIARGVNPEREFELWRDDCAAHGRVYSDWAAAWRTRVNRVPDFSRGRSGLPAAAAARQSELSPGMEKLRGIYRKVADDGAETGNRDSHPGQGELDAAAGGRRDCGGVDRPAGESELFGGAGSRG